MKYFKVFILGIIMLGSKNIMFGQQLDSMMSVYAEGFPKKKYMFNLIDLGTTLGTLYFIKLIYWLLTSQVF